MSSGRGMANCGLSLQWNATQLRKGNEQLTRRVTSGIDLKGVTLSEESQSQNVTYCMIPHM